MEKGTKYDNGKNRVALVLKGFAVAIWEVARVGTFGANKYGAGNWELVENGVERYNDALQRHLFKYYNGQILDEETHIHELAHVAWNALAILTLILKGRKDK